MKNGIQVLILLGRLLLQFVLWGGGFVLLCALVLLAYLSWTDYLPPPAEPLGTTQPTGVQAGSHRIFSLCTWNIGYAGLGREMDFFYDGGLRVRSSFDDFQRNINGIGTFISRNDSIDLFLLQEVDKASRRSFFTDQPDILDRLLPDHNAVFATNYKVPFIPIPPLNPIGEVLGGLLSLSRLDPLSAERIASPANFSWPRRLFFLDRCFLVCRYQLSPDTQLVVVNLHQSAWAEGETLRRKELETLREILLSEFCNGNYVIAGGDWNQNPPGFGTHRFASGDSLLRLAPPLGEDYLPGWRWAWDPAFPTNRDLSEAYGKGRTATTILDFFLLSPNVKVEEIRTLSLGFRFSDHNPVYLRVRLGP